MAIDIKEKIEEIAKKITSDKTLAEKFKKDPVSAIESVIGIDLPDDVTEKIVAGVKAKLGADKVSGAVDALKKLF